MAINVGEFPRIILIWQASSEACIKEVKLRTGSPILHFGGVIKSKLKDVQNL